VSDFVYTTRSERTPVIGRISNDNSKKFPIEYLDALSHLDGDFNCLIVAGEKYYSEHAFVKQNPGRFEFPQVSTENLVKYLALNQ